MYSFRNFPKDLRETAKKLSVLYKWIGLAKTEAFIERKSEVLPPTTTLTVKTNNSPIFRYPRPVMLAIRFHLTQPLVAETRTQIFSAEKRST